MFVTEDMCFWRKRNFAKVSNLNFMKSCGHCTLHYVKAFAFIGALSFLIQYLWTFVLAGDDVRQFNEMILKTFVVGYTGKNAISVLYGLLEWALCGAVFGAILAIFAQSHECNCCGLTKTK